jgi:molybdopterin converting factor small subunit
METYYRMFDGEQVQAERLERSMLLPREEDTLQGEPGDYLVEFADGSRTILTDMAFWATFSRATGVPAEELEKAPEDRTVEELKDELRERDLPVSGTKDELIDRLAEADEPSADEDLTKSELLDRARELDIEGRSSMNKEELAEAVAEAEASEENAGSEE